GFGGEDFEIILDGGRFGAAGAAPPLAACGVVAEAHEGGFVRGAGVVFGGFGTVGPSALVGEAEAMAGLVGGGFGNGFVAEGEFGGEDEGFVGQRWIDEGRDDSHAAGLGVGGVPGAVAADNDREVDAMDRR